MSDSGFTDECQIARSLTAVIRGALARVAVDPLVRLDEEESSVRRRLLKRKASGRRSEVSKQMGAAAAALLAITDWQAVWRTQSPSAATVAMLPTDNLEEALSRLIADAAEACNVLDALCRSR